MLKLRINTLVTTIALLCTLAGSVCGESLKLWYNQPGTNNTQQGLMLGNGRLGGIVPGNPSNETIILNENSLWTGNLNLNANSFGSYQLFGKLLLKLPAHASYGNYRRELDLADAAARVDYTVGTTNYHREIFCSAPDQVMVIRLTADTAASYTGTLQLTDGHSATSQSITGGITNAGALSNGEKYATRIFVQNEGGTLTSASGTVSFTNCNALTIFVAMKTDYVFDYSRLYHGADPAPVAQAQIAAASGKSYPALWTAHTNDFQSIFNRVALDLGPAPVTRTNLPTDQRLAALIGSGDDVGLERLLFQYGRYLLISCSRPGGLPANLQGLWVDSNKNPWNSDYHANINVQMNYWAAEAANMSECHQPLFDLIQSQLVPWREVTAQAFNNPNGWALRTSHNIHGGMDWNWNKPGNAWYCQHLWEHFAFTRDTNYLQNVAYPIIKEICQFWQAELKEMPDGTLVAPNGWSPEHGPVEDGVTYDQVLIWDLFNNYVEASSVLGVDPDYRATISTLRDKLLKPRVGPWGEIREWLYHPDNPTDIHRTTPHLLALYPGRQISETLTPELAKAARVSLAARLEIGENRHPWVWAWRCALWARLDDGEEAHRMISNLLRINTFPNLIGNYLSTAVAQWDGNFGITGAMCEMLLQSQAGEIQLLPALPSVWPTGSVTGLRARGGFTVGMFWANGALTNAEIQGPAGASCIVRYGGETNQLTMDAGGSAQFVPGTIPGGLAVLAGNTQVSLNWNPSAGATNYILKRSTANGGPYTNIATTTTTRYTDTGLANGTTYHYVVSALSAAGESGDSSPATATPTPPPNAPTGLASQPLDGMAVVQWNAVAGATSYKVKWSIANGGPYAVYGVAVGTTNYSVFGLTNGTMYYCVVSAVIGEQESPDSVQLAVVIPIAPPTGLTATPGNTQVSLSWSASSGATSYQVKQATTSGGPYTTIASPTGTSYTNTALTNGTTYFYVVSSVNSTGESADSGQASATPVYSSSPTTYQAESGTLGGDAAVNTSFSGYTGTGSVDLPNSGGFAQINNVTGNGGSASIAVRFSNGGTTGARTGLLLINGVSQSFTTPATGSWTTWSTVTVMANLTSGTGNTLRFESNGQDLGLIDAVTVTPLALATVTIVTTDAIAGEFGADQTIGFTISRTGATSAALAIPLAASGTASAGSDYSGFSSSVSIPSGQASVTLTLTVITDSLAEGSETVTIALGASAGFTAGSPASASATIADNPSQGYFFTAIANPANRGPNDDADGDSSANIVEYFMGSNPDSAGSQGVLTIPSVGAGSFKVRYLRAKNRPAVGGSLRWSSNLTHWFASGQSDGITIIFAEAVVSDSAADPETVEATATIVGPGNVPPVFVRLAVQ
jgi:alpha-L-fucosidase 2